MLTGENGILKRAKESKEETELATKEEEETLYKLEDMINEIDTVVLEKGKVAEKTQKNNYIDQYGNKATIPKGFKVSENTKEDDITEGLVIKDEEGNEFVWIPVGDVIDPKGETHKIELKRYVFNNEGEIDEEKTKINPEDELRQGDEDYFYTEGKEKETTANAHAKNIEKFISNVKRYGGYYIGRYEARKSSSNGVTEKSEDKVYGNVSQNEAASLTQGMYDSNGNFESDLMNSYAYSTAIVFLQIFDDRTLKEPKFSLVVGYDNDEVKLYGSSGSSEKDVICNIFDMSSNFGEYVTETFNNSDRWICVRMRRIRKWYELSN